MFCICCIFPAIILVVVVVVVVVPELVDGESAAWRLVGSALKSSAESEKSSRAMASSLPLFAQLVGARFTYTSRAMDSSFSATLECCLRCRRG